MRKTSYFLIVATCLFLLISGSLHHFFAFTPQYPIVKLVDNWIVTYRNDQYINANLTHISDHIGPTLSKGDTLTLNLTSPLQMGDVPFPSIIFQCYHCAYEVYLDNTLIDEKNMDDTSGIKFLGIGYHTVNLPSDYNGKKLSIKLYITENNTSTDLLTPLLGNFDDLYRSILHDVLFPGFTALFLILFGFVFLIISIVFFMKSSGVSSQVICSILSTVLGFWMLNFYDTIDFYIAPAFSSFIEYSAMYLIVPLVFVLLYNQHKRHNSNVIIFLSYCSLGFALLFITLHLLNIVHIHHFKTPCFLISVICLIVLAVYDYYDIRFNHKNSSRLILMLGLTVLMLTLTIYSIFIFFKLYIGFRHTSFINMLVPLGSLFFVVAQLLNHFIFMTRMFAQRKEYASLTQIAYIDNLTEIPNRASCDKRLVELGEVNSDYCILSLDLNGLKEVNDNAGHPAGDRLLKSFAGALKDSAIMFALSRP